MEMCLAIALAHAIENGQIVQTETHLGPDSCGMCLEVSAQWTYGPPDYVVDDAPYWAKELVCEPVKGGE